MNCKSCNKPITSKITGELCTACYFTMKKNNEIKETEQRPKAEEEKYEITEEIKEINAFPTIEEEIKHIPSVSKNQTKDPTKKYCQSCIERGYGLTLATREWTTGYFICDDCFNPLINNMLGREPHDIEKVKDIVEKDVLTPALENFYNLLNIPIELRFSSSDKVINGREDIQNHEATAIINMSDAEVIEQIEHYRVVLFNIRYRLDPHQERINRIKAQVREEKNVTGIVKSKKEVTKKSNAKLNDQEKLAVRLFPHLKDNPAEAVKMMQEIAKQAKEKEFNRLTGK